MATPKFYCVATEGSTTDGREISRTDIEQMAANYDFSTRAARMNVEHVKGIDPTGQFGSYGDVLALKTDNVQVKVGGKDVTRLGLFAQIKPLDNLKALTEAGQKLYTSIEINPNFANTNTAYLMGVAVTDNPASLGTEVLQFCAGKGAASFLASRKSEPNNLFTAAQAVTFDFSEGGAGATGAGGGEGGILDKILSILTFSNQQPAPVVAAPVAPAATITPLAAPAHNDQFSAALVAMAKNHDATVARLEASLVASDQRFTALTQRLENTPQRNFSHRPQATGGNDAAVTDC